MIKLFCKEALKNKGWGDVDPKNIKLVDHSGLGGSKTFKISAEGANPSIVAFHARTVKSEDSNSEKRMNIAHNLFSSAGFSPSRLAGGEDWFVEPW